MRETGCAAGMRARSDAGARGNSRRGGTSPGGGTVPCAKSAAGPCRADVAGRRERVRSHSSHTHLFLLACLAAARLSAPLARPPGVAAPPPPPRQGAGAPRPGALLPPGPRTGGESRRELLVLRGGGGFKFMEDPSRRAGAPEPGAGAKGAEADSDALGSSELENEYLLSGGAGDDDDDHVLSSLPDEAKSDYEPSAASGDDELDGASVHSLDAHVQNAAGGDADMRDDQPGGASASADSADEEGEAHGAAAHAHGGGTAGGLVAEVELLNGRLLNASRAGDVALIRQLVAQGASPNAVTPVERDQEFCHVAMRPLHLAAAGGHLDAYQALVDLGAAVRTEAGTGETELHFAAEHGHADVVRTLLDTASFRFCPDDAGCANTSGNLDSKR